MTAVDRHLQTLQQAPRRLLLGIAVMLASAGLGSAVFASERAEVMVWSAARDLAAGAELGMSELVAVGLPPAAAAAAWPADTPVPAGSRAAHQLLGGEIITARDVAETGGGGAEVALALPAAELPAGLRVGDQVALWLVDPAGGMEVAPAAEVIDLTADAAARATRVTVRVPPAYLSEILGAAAADALRLVLGPG